MKYTYIPSLTTIAWLPQRDLPLVHDYISRGKVGYVCTNSVVTFCIIQGEAARTGYNRVQRGPPTRAVPNPNDPSYSHFPEVSVLIKYSSVTPGEHARDHPSAIEKY